MALASFSLSSPLPSFASVPATPRLQVLCNTYRKPTHTGSRNKVSACRIVETFAGYLQQSMRYITQLCKESDPQMLQGEPDLSFLGLHSTEPYISPLAVLRDHFTASADLSPHSSSATYTPYTIPVCILRRAFAFFYTLSMI